MSLDVTTEPEFDIPAAELNERRRPSHFTGGRSLAIIAAERQRANLVDDYLWLSEGGMSFESIAQRLNYEPRTMEKYLVEAGFSASRLHPSAP